MIKMEDFEPIDLWMYECVTKQTIWGTETDILITYCEAPSENGYDYFGITQCAHLSNLYLEWIEQHQKYIQKMISKDTIFQSECGGETDADYLYDKFRLREIEMKISADETVELEQWVCMYIDAKPFICPEYCHCIEAVISTKEDGTYEVDIIEDMQRLLLEIRDASRERAAKVCEWAKKHGIYYAFDDNGNMLAAVRQQFGLSKDNKLISRTDDDDRKTERNAIYFIWAEWEKEEHLADSRKGLPMPSGFVIKDLTCKQNVFTITSSSGHETVSGAFFVMMEALYVIETLYWGRGATEEEIENCYYGYLVEDHRKYRKNKKE